MSINDFAMVGMFAISMTAFALGTALLGLMTSIILFDDVEHTLLISWILGVVTYGLTIMIMWGMMI